MILIGQRKGLHVVNDLQRGLRTYKCYFFGNKGVLEKIYCLWFSDTPDYIRVSLTFGETLHPVVAWGKNIGSIWVLWI